MAVTAYTVNIREKETEVWRNEATETYTVEVTSPEAIQARLHRQTISDLYYTMVFLDCKSNCLKSLKKTPRGILIKFTWIQRTDSILAIEMSRSLITESTSLAPTQEYRSQ